ncbi:MAG: DMT family transporter [Planctomycetota bacterium]
MPPALRVLLAGALFSTGGSLIKLQTLPSLQRAGSRALLAALVIFLLLPQARRLPTRRILLLAPAYFGATALFVVANTMTTAANAIFLQSTAPLWVVLLAPLLLGERPTRSDLAVLFGVAVGMALFFVAPAAAAATAPNPRLGDWIAIASGVSFALLLIGMRWLVRGGSGEECAAIAWSNLIACPLAFACMPLVGQTPIAGVPLDWVVVGALGTLQMGLAYSLLVTGIPHVSALQASLLTMIEPVLSAGIAWLAHGEAMHPMAMLGGASIVAAVLAGAWLARGGAPRSG